MKYTSVYGGFEDTPLARYPHNAFDQVPAKLSLARLRRAYDAEHGAGSSARMRTRFRRKLRMCAQGYATERAGLIHFLSSRARPPL